MYKFPSCLVMFCAVSHAAFCYSAVCRLYYGKFPILIVSDPEFLKQIMIKDSNSFVDRFVS